MDNFKIHIPDPCPKNWEKMTPEKDGRHCSACNKVVIDFTSMNTEEIRNYFANHTGKRVCGHFRDSQVNIASGPLQNRLSRMHEIIETKLRIPFLKTSLLFVLGLIVLAAGCRNKATTGEPLPVENCNSSGTKNRLTGDTIYSEQKDAQRLTGEPVFPSPGPDQKPQK